MLMGGTLRNFCTDVLLGVLVDGVLFWWCVGVGRHAVGLWENRPTRSCGVCGCCLFTAMDCYSLCWGWWFGCVVVVFDL